LDIFSPPAPVLLRSPEQFPSEGRTGMIPAA
jgi:hypothetical protein